MGREISLFSGYSQKENRTTNYCLLVLKLLYQEHPKFLAEALSTIVGGGSGVQVGVQFQQQVGKGASVPDGIITQPSFAVYIETKNFDWFYSQQLSDHLIALAQENAEQKIMLALSNFEGDVSQRFKDVQKQCTEQYGGRIVFAAVTFQELLDAVRLPGLSPSLNSTIDEFEQYLNHENLLPDWKGRLDVCNCSQFAGMLVSANVYICPAEGGAYSHSRCEFLGLYWSKYVRYIANVRGVVDLYKDNTHKLLWINDGSAEGDIVDLARQRFKQAYLDNTDWNARVFVLGPLVETAFHKNTSGGMRSSREYFWVRHLLPASPEELAEKLRAATWSKLK
ncbi:hypothetical protein ACW9KT_09085 [Hymenobacter sp. HD11105]